MVRRCGRFIRLPPIPIFPSVSVNSPGPGSSSPACGNTMKSQNVTVKDLLPGFVAAERGGVVRIAELQSQGYLYLRP